MKVVVGDGRLGSSFFSYFPPIALTYALATGYPPHAPYTLIHVGAAAPGPSPPQALIDQLASPGRMFIPVSQGSQADDQDVWQVDKDAEGSVVLRKLFGVRVEYFFGCLDLFCLLHSGLGTSLLTFYLGC